MKTLTAILLLALTASCGGNEEAIEESEKQLHVCENVETGVTTFVWLDALDKPIRRPPEWPDK